MLVLRRSIRGAEKARKRGALDDAHVDRVFAAEVARQALVPHDVVRRAAAPGVGVPMMAHGFVYMKSPKFVGVCPIWLFLAKCCLCSSVWAPI